MNNSLRILMVLHMRWQRNLGVARIQIELAEEFLKLGHIVEKFSYEDAFPNIQSRLEELTCNFSLKAKEFIKRNAYRFDIIDAHQMNLPFNKEELGFKGLLVARSAGLIPLYDQAIKLYKLEKGQWSLKALLRKIITYPSLRRYQNSFFSSLRGADLIILPNHDEFDYLKDIKDMARKCMVLPFGLSDMRQKTLMQATGSAQERLKNKEVVFIGYWSPRKGSRDWPYIMKQIKERVPNARFKFLGTGLPKEKVLKSLHLSLCDEIEIIPQFSDEELPGLLAGATVGVFPSYIEGFGFAVLEKLACGLPVVSYDIPGPRQMLRYLDMPLMVKPGDIKNFVNNVVKLLSLDEENYSRLSRKCIEVSQNFLWSKIAAQTLGAYSEFLKRNEYL